MRFAHRAVKSRTTLIVLQGNIRIGIIQPINDAVETERTGKGEITWQKSKLL